LGQLCVVSQYLLKAVCISPESRQWLHRAMVPPLRCRPPFFGAHNVAHRVARYLQLAGNRLDFTTLNEIGTPHPTNRIHRDHPPIDPLCDSRTSGHLRLAGEGSNLRADHPRFGVKIARRYTLHRPTRLTSSQCCFDVSAAISAPRDPRVQRPTPLTLQAKLAEEITLAYGNTLAAHNPPP